MLIKRRQFLQSGAMATAACMVPGFLKAFEKRHTIPLGGKSLVIIQLSGGNDGLNTVIPIRNDIYYRSRPVLGIKRTEALEVTAEAGLHPSLSCFKDLYNDGSLAILNNVGYPNPDRSHFRSMDIWQSASQSNEYIHTGWIGRYLDAQCNGCDMPTQAMEIDDVLSMALKGEKEKGIAFKDPGRLYKTTNEQYLRQLSGSHDHSAEKEPVDYLYKTMAETVSSADYILKQSRKRSSRPAYPQTEIGRSLKTISSLILSDINTRVYYVSLGSFDTHVAQSAQQKRLFTELNEAVQSFVKDLKDNNRFEDVMMMTFSEFGRRVAQNASGGTDHGTANNMFLISGGLKKQGLLNPLPDLTNLPDGDLKHTTDFKEVYATLLKRWLDADDTIILGKKYPYLDFI